MQHDDVHLHLHQLIILPKSLLVPNDFLLLDGEYRVTLSSLNLASVFR